MVMCQSRWYCKQPYNELHYAAGDFYAYEQDWELSALSSCASLWCVSLPAVLLGVGR